MKRSSPFFFPLAAVPTPRGWTRLGIDAWSLGLEAAAVVGLRTMKLAQGGAAAQTEADLMVREKVESLALLQTRAITGRLGASPAAAARNSIRHYRSKVGANRKRLTKG